MQVVAITRLQLAKFVEGAQIFIMIYHRLARILRIKLALTIKMATIAVSFVSRPAVS